MLLGRTSSEERHIPGGVRVARSVYNWEQPQAGVAYVRLASETHALYDEVNVNRFTLKTINYAYDPNNNQFGALKERQELDEANNPYRCTQYEYAQNTTGGNWLINYPLRETLYSGTCSGSKVSETLYRYAGSANPTQKALDNRGLLTYVLRLRDTSTNIYSRKSAPTRRWVCRQVRLPSAQAAPRASMPPTRGTPRPRPTTRWACQYR